MRIYVWLLFAFFFHFHGESLSTLAARSKPIISSPSFSLPHHPPLARSTHSCSTLNINHSEIERKWRRETERISSSSSSTSVLFEDYNNWRRKVKRSRRRERRENNKEKKKVLKHWHTNRKKSFQSFDCECWWLAGVYITVKSSPLSRWRQKMLSSRR